MTASFNDLQLAIFAANLPHAAERVAQRIAWRQGGENSPWCDVPIAGLAADCHVAEASVYRALQELRERGMLQEQNGPKGSRNGRPAKLRRIVVPEGVSSHPGERKGGEGVSSHLDERKVGEVSSHPAGGFLSSEGGFPLISGGVSSHLGESLKSKRDQEPQPARAQAREGAEVIELRPKGPAAVKPPANPVDAQRLLERLLREAWEDRARLNRGAWMSSEHQRLRDATAAIWTNAGEDGARFAELAAAYVARWASDDFVRGERVIRNPVALFAKLLPRYAQEHEDEPSPDPFAEEERALEAERQALERQRERARTPEEEERIVDALVTLQRRYAALARRRRPGASLDAQERDLDRRWDALRDRRAIAMSSLDGPALETELAACNALEVELRSAYQAIERQRAGLAS